MFQFHELCEMPLGAADFFGLFKNFHTLALDSVPIFGSHNRSSAYRFVTLVDVSWFQFPPLSESNFEQNAEKTKDNF